MAPETAIPLWAGLVLIPVLMLSLAQFVCLVLVIVEMFKRGETALGAVCIVLAFCSGIGTLIAFIYGWIKAGEWGLRKVMLTWTICFVINLVLVLVVAIGSAMLAPANLQPMRQVNAGQDRITA